MSAKSENLFMVSLKDAAAGGAVALALFGVLIGMKAEVASGLGGQLGIEYRWAAVAIAVAIVFGGRLLLNLFVWKTDKPVTTTAKGFLPSAKPLAKLGKYAMPVFLILAVVLPFLLTPSRPPWTPCWQPSARSSRPSRTGPLWGHRQASWWSRSPRAWRRWQRSSCGCSAEQSPPQHG